MHAAGPFGPKRGTPDSGRWATGGAGSEREAEDERAAGSTRTDHEACWGDSVPRSRPSRMQLVAAALSSPGYVTVRAIIGPENALDRVEGL